MFSVIMRVNTPKSYTIMIFQMTQIQKQNKSSHRLSGFKERVFTQKHTCKESKINLFDNKRFMMEDLK